MESQEIHISRAELISMCDKFLSNEIGKAEIENYASDKIGSDIFDWDGDKIISEVFFHWDNEEINFPINKVNMELWRKLLLTGVDELSEHNFWNVHIEPQKLICQKYQSKWNPINKDLMVGVSTEIFSDPINGLRHPSENGTTGWFIWSGEYSSADVFFKPMCAEHLLQKRPQIIKYLGLDVGFRFLADKNGHEDVWFDEAITKI